ncbi:unnamed protein product [Caenorhabditis auriculariae]|uniref:Large ribosomal subunit protein mL43 n=1 Tax=Caenorhabditis auriculariae TaxID=2777116 RepID=A0A8S1GM36_9PELO|nr:unnamed protein product [Caenorhabditis auriculariae]
MPSLPRVDRIKPIFTSAKALNYGWRFTDYLKIPAFNGVSRYIPQVHRITIRFCKQSESSTGVRNFVESHLWRIGESNPSVVIYTQPVRNSIPTIRAEYGNGKVIQYNAKNMSEKEIHKDFVQMLSRGGNPVVKLESRQNSITPSVQGSWTPITWLPTSSNVVPLPQKIAVVKKTEVSATEYFSEKT